MNYKYHFIYKTTNLINDKIYIGQHRTNDLNDGYIGCGIKRAYQSNGKTPFHRAVSKYGYENFKREILEFCDNFEELCEKEIFWIKKLNVVNVGYNILFEDKFSYKNNGKYNAFYGQKHSEQTKSHLRKLAKNREKLECPYCHKIMDSVNAKKYHFEKCIVLTGINPVSKETRLKNSKSQKLNNNKLIKCPHCGFESRSIKNMKRWHFDNCLKNPKISIDDVKNKRKIPQRIKDIVSNKNKLYRHSIEIKSKISISKNKKVIVFDEFNNIIEIVESMSIFRSKYKISTYNFYKYLHSEELINNIKFSYSIR